MDRSHSDPPHETEDEPWENADEDAERLAKTFAFTELQAKALVYESFYNLPKQEAISRLDTSESSYDNLHFKAVKKASESIAVAGDIEGGFRGTTVTPDIGGEAGDVITKTDGQYFFCEGCNDVHLLDSESSWNGRIHEEGLTDDRGRNWLLYVPCPDNPDWENKWFNVESRLFGEPTKYHAVIYERRKGNGHQLVLDVYDDPLKELLLARGVFQLTPTDQEEPDAFAVTNVSIIPWDAWNGEQKSISEEDFSGTSLRCQSEDETLFYYETDFKAGEPFHTTEKTTASVNFRDPPHGEFEFKLSDQYKTWFSRTFTLDDIGLEAYETPTES